MSTGEIIIGILLFALATIIIGIWGIKKENRQKSDLMSMLFSKGVSKVNKYLKKNESITLAQVEELCKDIKAKIPFSKTVAIVKDKRDFAKKLMEYMEKTDQVKLVDKKYIKVIKEK